MKWFKMEAWCGYNALDEETEGAEPGAASEWDVVGYEAHLALIKHRLPPDLLAASEGAHDARLLNVLTNLHAKRVVMIVQTTQSNQTWTFEGVDQVQWTNNLMALEGEPGFGTMGYDEIEIEASGLIVMRILFTTGLELLVTFRGFKMTTLALS